ncbi:MAG: DUF2341 domain-containing protein [Methanophagales archaeon]|nr:DUF2341 domain-containing protein [Methanophagales archaeon]
MFKTVDKINEFVIDLYNIDFRKRNDIRKIKRIKELWNAYITIWKIIKEKRKPFSSEFVHYLYPLLAVSINWFTLKSEEKLTNDFLMKCKRRVRTQTNFYGTIFEIDMACRAILSDWKVEFIEDYTKEGKQIDFVFINGDTKMGIECLSKISSKKIDIKKINRSIQKKADKFKPEYVKKLGISLDKKILILDMTRENYLKPDIIPRLHEIVLDNKLDAVIFTWREDIWKDENHSLLAKYVTLGDFKKEYFTITMAADFIVVKNKPYFFMRKYIEPNPSWCQSCDIELWSFAEFSRRIRIPVSPAIKELKDYQMKIKIHYGEGNNVPGEIYCSSLCQKDFGDIRFVTEDGRYLSYWIEKQKEGDYAIMWIKLSDIPMSKPKDYFVYFGKRYALDLERKC